MKRHDWRWWRFRFIYRESVEAGFGVMVWRSPWGTGYTLDIWTGRRFWTVRWLRHYE